MADKRQQPLRQAVGERLCGGNFLAVLDKPSAGAKAGKGAFFAGKAVQQGNHSVHFVAGNGLVAVKHQAFSSRLAGISARAVCKVLIAQAESVPQFMRDNGKKGMAVKFKQTV